MIPNDFNQLENIGFFEKGNLLFNIARSALVVQLSQNLITARSRDVSCCTDKYELLRF